MSRAAKCAVAVATIAFVLVAIAFWIKPRACEGGLEIYFFCGLAALPAMAALPFGFGIGKSVMARVASALGLVVLGIAAWVAGLFAANVQILCRLF